MRHQTRGGSVTQNMTPTRHTKIRPLTRGGRVEQESGLDLINAKKKKFIARKKYFEYAKKISSHAKNISSHARKKYFILVVEQEGG